MMNSSPWRSRRAIDTQKNLRPPLCTQPNAEVLCRLLLPPAALLLPTPREEVNRSMAKSTGTEAETEAEAEAVVPKRASQSRAAKKQIGSPAPLLTRRTLNRALLARQLLLERSPLSPLAAIEHLVGMQSQAPTAPYVGLWSRLKEFHTDDLSRLMETRQTVRLSLMRSTIHLVSARDCLPMRDVLRSVHARMLKGNFGRKLADIDPAELAAEGRALVEEQPLTFAELGALLRDRRWPDRDAQALAMAVRAYVPLVQVTPRGIWGASGPSAHTTAEAWLGETAALHAERSASGASGDAGEATASGGNAPVDTASASSATVGSDLADIREIATVPADPGSATAAGASITARGPVVETAGSTASSAVAQLLLRYLAAFGPASLKDMAAWSGLTGLRPAIEALRPDLRVYRDEQGTELFDVPGAPLPDETTPAPVRFLAEFDNILLSHADRSRIIPEVYRPLVFTDNGIIRSAFTVDGFVAGLWRIDNGKSSAELVVSPFVPLADDVREALTEEGMRLLAFAANEHVAERRVVIATPNFSEVPPL